MTRRAGSIAVVGGGSWGTAMAALLTESDQPVTMWAREPAVVDSVNNHNENALFHPGIALPPNLRADNDLDKVVTGAELVVMAVPTQFTRAVSQEVNLAIGPGVPLVSLAKGIEAGTLFRPTQIIADSLDGDHPTGVLSGPNLAREILLGMPASTVLAFEDLDLAHELQPLFTAPVFDVYTNDDVIGCELGGSIKNVIAVAAGMAAGLDLGLNSIAALVCRGLVEMATLGSSLGARSETFLGLAGQGDLVATCLSEDSRNHHFGRELAKGRSVAEIATETNMVAEGVKSVDNLLALAASVNVETPLMNLVRSVVSGELTPAEAFENGRPTSPTHELHELINAPTGPANGDPP